MVDIAGLNQDPFLWWPRKSFQKSGPAVFWPQLRWLYTYSCSKLLGLWSFSARLLLWSPWRGHFLLDVVLHHDEPFRFYLFLPFYTQYYISYCWNNIVINVWNIWLVVVWNMIFLNDFPYNGNNNLNWRTHIFQMLWFYSRNTANVMIDWWDMADMGMSENGVYPPHVELGKMIF